MIEKILDKAKKEFDSVEVVELKKTDTSVGFQANVLKSLKTNERLGYALRAIKDGKIAFTSSSKPDDFDGIIERAKVTLKYSPTAEVDFAKKENHPTPVVTDPKIKQLDAASMIKMSSDAVESLRDLHKNVKIMSGVAVDNVTMRIVTSNGFDGSYERDDMSMGAGAILTDGDNFLQVGQGLVGSSYVGDGFADLISTVRKYFTWGMKNVPIESGKHQVLFAPSAVNDILGIIQASINGTSVFKKVSPFEDKVGQQIMDSRVSIYDDSTANGLPSSMPFDDEGTPSQRTPIVENGVLKGFIADRTVAKKLGIAPTGNGFRASGKFSSTSEIESPITTATSNTIITPGVKNSDEIFSGIKNGVLVVALMGSMMGNPLTGMLAGNVGLGYVIKDGQVTGRIKNAMLSVNLFEALKDSVVDISSDTYVTSSWARDICVPYMLLDNCVVAAK